MMVIHPSYAAICRDGMYSNDGNDGMYSNDGNPPAPGYPDAVLAKGRISLLSEFRECIEKDETTFPAFSALSLNRSPF